MREYSLWSRRASKGLNGYAALFSPPLDRASAVTRLPTPAVANRRANASLRRRQVLTVMFTAISMPALVALATGSMTAWWVVVAMLPFVSTYVAVLFRTGAGWLSVRSTSRFTGLPVARSLAWKKCSLPGMPRWSVSAAGGAISRF